MCYKCIYLIPHYFCDQGGSPPEWLRASPLCLACAKGEHVPPFFVHDEKNFNVEKYYRKG